MPCILHSAAWEHGMTRGMIFLALILVALGSNTCTWDK